MDNYDEELERIRKYIEKRRANNYGMNSSNGNNPLYKKENTEILSRISNKDSDDLNRVYNKSIINNNDKINGDSIDIDIEELYEEEKKIKKVSKRSDKNKKNEHETLKKYNIFLTISLMMLFIFMTLYIISTHSTLLIKKPFNLISLGIGGFSFICIIIALILKISHRDLSKSNHNFNVKLTIIAILLLLLLTSLIPIVNILHFWEYMDFVIAHKKRTVFAILLVIFIMLIIFIIRVIMHKRFKANTRRVLLT